MIIDSHIHCGIQTVSQPIELVEERLVEAGVEVACLFAPVEDIYDRWDPDFVDTPQWRDRRRRANEYLLTTANDKARIHAYYFVWNDFRFEDLGAGYRGVKWHRHSTEPEYNYDDPRCEEFLRELYRLELPVVLEETFENTMMFLDRVGGRTPVIIPHLGGLNGGFRALLNAGIWERERVYADTALASPWEMSTFLERHGCEKLIFGSDWPFSTPCAELEGVRSLGLDPAEFDRVTYRNIAELIKLPL